MTVSHLLSPNADRHVGGYIVYCLLVCSSALDSHEPRVTNWR